MWRNIKCKVRVLWPFLPPFKCSKNIFFRLIMLEMQNLFNFLIVLCSYSKSQSQTNASCAMTEIHKNISLSLIIRNKPYNIDLKKSANGRISRPACCSKLIMYNIGLKSYNRCVEIEIWPFRKSQCILNYCFCFLEEVCLTLTHEPYNGFI